MPPSTTGRRHAKHIQKKQHADHDLIVKRLEEYIKAYRTGKPEVMMQFYHPNDFVYSDFSTCFPHIQLPKLTLPKVWNVRAWAIKKSMTCTKKPLPSSMT